MPEIRVTPGGFVSAKARHLIGPRGASPFITNPATIEGFQNLVAYYGEIAWPVMNSASDFNDGFAMTHFLGNDTQGALDNIDVVSTGVMSTVAFCPLSPSNVLYALNVTGEFAITTGSAVAQPNVGSEAFTTAGTVTLTAGSNIVTGVGTTWTADVLTGPYTLTPNFNKIYNGDILRVQVSAGRFFSFRITGVTDNLHLTIYPTPSPLNPALGAGKTYSIWRTGYNSSSRYLAFSDAGVRSYMYYCGNSGANGAAGYPHGTLQCVKIDQTGNRAHYMAPQTTDASGAAVADIQADDIAYYKGFILYGAGPAVSWSAPGAPNTLPFANTDFPAKNISAFAPFDTFVSFEYLGDQVVAMFEDSMWLVTATGSVPEFAFYKLPELMGIINPAKLDPSQASYVHGRPSASGRGTVYYLSNRGIESMGGSLADEATTPISNSLLSTVGTGALYVGWDVGTDTVLVRAAFPSSETPQSLIYNPKTQDWSTLLLAPPAGQSVVALTPGVQPISYDQDHSRLFHIGYYETLKVGGTPITNGADIRRVAGRMDQNSPQTGLVPWEWVTPVIPTSLTYPDFSTGGFILDAYSLNTSLPVTVTWTLYGGASPYNLFVRQTDTVTFGGTLASPWITTRQRLSKKVDDPFVMVKLTSASWAGTVALTLFDSATQVMR